MSNRPLKLELSADDYRTLSIPGDPSTKGKLSTCFISVEQLPDDLKNWTDVNPRTPKTSKSEKLSGQVARSIVKTLEQEPEKFALKNLGVYLLVETVESERIKGDRHRIKLKLENKSLHGIVNGGHTFKAIRQVVNAGDIEKNTAFVRLHIYQGIKEEQIVDLAEGLNRNLQVQEKSLADLQKKFEPIADAMKGKKGAEEIAYSEGDDGKVDILEVLHMLSLLDCNSYPESQSHPHDLFGKKQVILEKYLADIKKSNSHSSFSRLTPFVHEILELSEKIQQACMRTSYNLGRYKVKESNSKNRVGSHKREAYFTEGDVGTLFPQGWLYPMIAAFRANISKKSWREGRIEWLYDIDELINASADKLAQNILQVHNDHKQKPGEVGRKQTAYELCYGTVFMELAMKGKLEIIE